MSEAKEKFRKFINEFVDEDAEDVGDGFDPLEPLYTQRLDEVGEMILVMAEVAQCIVCQIQKCLL